MWIATLLFALQAPAPAQEQAPPPAPQSAASKDAFLALVKDYGVAKNRWILAERALTGDEARAAHQALKPVHEFWPRVEALVAAGDARGLVWMCEAIADKLDERDAIVARKREWIDKLLAEHADAPWAASELVAMLGRQRPWFDEQWVRARLADLTNKSKNDEVRAAALFEQARRLDGSKSSPEEKLEAAALRERITKEFSKTRAGGELAARANAQAVEIGGAAPDFEAVDGEGLSFKLSDYRGKVVLLDFWGFWCGPCVASLPHVRTLAERFKDAPFSVIGVNTDSDRQRFVEQCKARNVTWRNAFTGGQDNAISRQYRIRGYPTMLLIDAQGVIRRRYLGPPTPRELERAIEEQLEAARAAGK